MYTLARMGIVPLSLLLTATISRTSHSVAILSSALTATLNLLIASSRAGVRVTWESIVAGVFSSLFVAIYPILLLSTYRNLRASLTPQGDLLAEASPGAETSDTTATREGTRAAWQLLHYTSSFSILFITMIVLISGEISHISRNCYFLDVPFFWFVILQSGLQSGFVFLCTILLTVATSPLTVSFLFIPRSAFQLVILSHFKMPVYCWVGIGMCWLSSLWFLLTRRREGRKLDRLRLETS